MITASHNPSHFNGFKLKDSYGGPMEDAFVREVEQKIGLDELHKRKIDLADEVLVLNIGGYIGDSTRSEIEYAGSLGMPIRYQEPR